MMKTKGTKSQQLTAYQDVEKRPVSFDGLAKFLKR
jgi:hypothetical protein